MTALFSHERVCPDCDGRTCSRCDGVGIITVERRDEYPDARAIIAELMDSHREPLIRALRSLGALAEKRTDQLNVLTREIKALGIEFHAATERARRAERECDRLRVIVQAQARLLDKSEPIASPSKESPHGADDCGLGAARQ